MRTQNYRDPTPEEYAVVKACYEKTGMMTVKDSVTAEWVKPQARCGGIAPEKPWQDRREYGADYRPNVAGQNVHETGFATLTRHRRAIRLDHVGTSMFGDAGIAVGGVETWVTPDVFGKKTPECVKWQSDLGPDEEERLHRMARGIHHVTQSEYDKAEDESRRRAANRTETQVDPAGAIVKALVPALAESMKQAAQANSAPSADDLAAAGFYKDTDGTWKRRALAGAGTK